MLTLALALFFLVLRPSLSFFLCLYVRARVRPSIRLSVCVCVSLPPSFVLTKLCARRLETSAVVCSNDPLACRALIGFLGRCLALLLGPAVPCRVSWPQAYYYQKVQLFHFDVFEQTMYFIAITVMSYALAMVLHIMVELPFASLTKLIIPARR